MIVNMSSTATQEEINHVMDRIKECGFLPHLIQGAERTVIGVVGKNRGRRSEIESLRVAPGVEDIIPISQPFTLVSLELQTKRTIVDVKGVEIGGPELVVMAGHRVQVNADSAAACAYLFAVSRPLRNGN